MQCASVAGYAVSYETDGTRLDTVLTLQPYMNVSIRWVGDEPFMRPDSITLELYRKSDDKRQETKKAKAAEGWSIRFDACRIGSDYKTALPIYPTGYSVSGPELSEDGFGLVYTCTYQGAMKYEGDLLWHDGAAEQKNPDVLITLDNGRGDTISRLVRAITGMESYNLGQQPLKDADGNPYEYSLQAQAQEASTIKRYFVSMIGMDVELVKNTSLKGTVTYLDADGNEKERPAWLEEPVSFSLWRAVEDGAYEKTDAKAVWTGESFEFKDLPLGVAGSKDMTARWQYLARAETGAFPLKVTDKGVTYDKSEARYTQSFVIQAEPFGAAVPFRVEADFDTYHPEREFSVVLKDKAGTVLATGACTLPKNGKSVPGGLFARVKEEGTYYLSLVQDGEAPWTLDDSIIPVRVRINPGTGETEVTAEGGEAVFHVRYDHVPEPVETVLYVRTEVENGSPLKTVPEQTFLFDVNAGGETASVSIGNAGTATVRSKFTKPGKAVVTITPRPANTNLWVFDETEKTLEIEVTMDEDGVLRASYPAGSEAVFKNTFVSDETEVGGLAVWSEHAFVNGAEEKELFRPDTVTLSVVPYGTETPEEEVIKSVTVGAKEGDRQLFSFGTLPRFNEEGTPLFYSVIEEPLSNYETTEDYGGLYSVLNELTAEAEHPAGSVFFENDEEESRPGSVTVRLFRRVQGGEEEEIGSRLVSPDRDGSWYYDFGFFPLRQDAVPGYATTVNGYDITNSPAAYRITYGNGQTHYIGSGEDALFVCDGPFEKFTFIAIDGARAGTDVYTVSEGSTKLALYAEYLDSLAEGKYTIRFFYTDGASDTGFFYVADKSPKTGDTARPGLYFGLTLLSFAGLILTRRRLKKA